MNIQRLTCAFMAVTVVGLALARTSPGLEVRVAGPAETVFAWDRDRCDRDDIPDAPARAFRDAAGTVHLIATHYTNRALRGPALGAVRPDCQIIYEGSRSSAPEAFDDRVWITAVYTRDGRTIHALGHAEYHGHLRPRSCPAAIYMKCWSNAVVELISRNGGLKFDRAGSAPSLVAALPYRYDGLAGRHWGYFGPSNIIQKDGYHYAFVFTEAFNAQKRGSCLIRTERLGVPEAWRAHDGRDFTIRFIDPYRDGDYVPENHVCAPVPSLTHMVRSVVRHVRSGKYIVLMAYTPSSGAERTAGVYYTTSTDLLIWAPPRLLHAVPLTSHFDCAATAVYSYPSILDEDSRSLSFDDISDRAYLYLTRFNMSGCKWSMNRDLVRLPLRFMSSG